jgi:hypothetical protein
MSDKNNLRILHIQGENFMRLKCVDITLSNGLVEVTGDNRQGKSAVLTMIHAMKGKKFLPEVPVNVDARKGNFTITIGPEADKIAYTVEYNFTAKGAYLKVQPEPGYPGGSAQDVLNSIISRVLDPWEIIRMATGTPAERKKALDLVQSLMKMPAVGAEFITELGYDPGDAKIKAILTDSANNPIALLKGMEALIGEYRKQWNAEVQRLEASADTLKQSIPIDKRNAKPVDIGELLTKQKDMNSLRQVHVDAKNEEERIQNSITEKKNELAALLARLAEFQARTSTLAPFDPAKAQEIEAQLANVTEANNMAQKAASLRATTEQAKDAGEKAEGFDADIKRIREKMLDVQEQAEVPVDGMTIENGTIMLDGLPIDQASDEQKLSWGIDIGAALFEYDKKPDAPMLRALVCANASLMGEKALAVLADKAEEHDIQVILELVRDKAAPGVIVVEDGVAKNS